VLRVDEALTACVAENFQQASADYEAALQHLTPLLHAHSRRLADAYLRLGLALEFHPDADRRRDAEKYVRAAATALSRRREAVQARLATLSKGDEAARAEAAAAELREAAARAAAASDSKGKGRSQDTDVFERDDVVDMDEEKAQKELRDVQEIAEELKNKVRVLATLLAEPCADAFISARRVRGCAARQQLAGPSRLCGWQRPGGTEGGHQRGAARRQHQRAGGRRSTASRPQRAGQRPQRDGQEEEEAREQAGCGRGEQGCKW
jgi:hypothetical protein